MISKKPLASIPLAAVLLLGTSACAPETSGNTFTNDGGSTSGQDRGTSSSQSGSLDADGFAIPNEPVTLKVGESLDYYSFASLTKEEAQRVTIESFSYIELGDLPGDAPASSMSNGVLVLSVIWHAIKGDVQSNDAYLVVTTGSGDSAPARWFGNNQLDNGGVDAGEARTGNLMYEIPRGKTTVTIVDYSDNPVGVMHIDTSK